MTEPQAREAMDAYLDERREEQSDGYHPPDLVLDTYRLGKLPEFDADDLRDHLSRCTDCTDRYLDMVDDARMRRTIAICGLGAGLVAMVGAALLSFVDVYDPD